MRSKYNLFFILAMLLLLIGCAGSKMQTYRSYNALGRSVHLSLLHDGYIIGIEKRPRGEVGDPADGYSERFDTVKVKPRDNIDTRDALPKRNKIFKNVTSHPAAMLVTQIDRYQRGAENPGIFYNAYQDYENPFLDYELGYFQLERLKEDLENRLNAAKQETSYSHIIVMSMGWNNDQHESIWRYNKMINELKQAASGNTDFKPLIIGFTWPSVWFGIEDSWFKRRVIGFLFSYFNKTNDADEIGYTIASWVINNIVLGSKEKHNLKVVLIGHSLGARILSRATFSDDHIIKRENSSEVDLFIGLQGAFSANRFVTKKGWEGYPYAEFYNRSTSFTLTSSQHDKANPFARFFTGAKHVGGKYGLKTAEEYPDIFKVIRWTNNMQDNNEEIENALPQIQNPTNKKKIIMVDASSIVKGYDAHNDILDEEMADLIWTLIKESTMSH